MTSKEAQEWVQLALIAAGVYVGYKVISGIGQTISSVGANLTGPAQDQTWSNYLFGSGQAPPAPNPTANQNSGGVDFGAPGPW